MIQKYFLITVKDKDGFAVPFTNNTSSTPVLYKTTEEAQEELDYIRGMYITRLAKPEPKPKKKGLLDAFRQKAGPTDWPEEKKQQMRWFLATADIKGVTLSV